MVYLHSPMRLHNIPYLPSVTYKNVIFSSPYCHTKAQDRLLCCATFAPVSKARTATILLLLTTENQIEGRIASCDMTVVSSFIGIR
jgi:hypothetical protein